MAKAAKVKIRVSTQPVVVMEAEVARKIRQHARGSMKAEVCGVLIGNTEHELLIQQNFFSNPQQVAWVYDPHTDEEGCFGWVGDKIEKLTAIRVGYSQNIDVSA